MDVVQAVSNGGTNATVEVNVVLRERIPGLDLAVSVETAGGRGSWTRASPIPRPPARRAC
jgi:hypothetical protein